MRSLIAFFASRPRLAAVLSGFLLLIAIGAAWEIERIYDSWNHVRSVATAQPVSSSVPSPSVVPVNSGGEDPRVRQIMADYHVGRKAANYIAQAKLQITEQTDTSVHFVVIFPDQTTLNETVSIAADPQFVSRPPAKATQTRPKTHGAKLIFKTAGPKTWTYTLQYHVPYSALP